jgi:hypothetical protein
MTRSIRNAARVGAIGVAIAILTVAAAAQQSAKATSSAASSVKSGEGWTPQRTAWGDPDLQGTYTNKDESGIPFERSNQFEGKALADVDDVELAELIRERQKQIFERAPPRVERPALAPFIGMKLRRQEQPCLVGCRSRMEGSRRTAEATGAAARRGAGAGGPPTLRRP